MRLLDPDRPGRLRDVVVFLSGSVPNREGFEKVADAPFLIEQAVVSLARSVFAEGGRIVFGAHPSISPLVASVASEYKPAGSEDTKRPVIIYQSHAFDEVLPTKTWDMYRYGFADLVWTDAKNGERYRKGDAASRKCPISLTHMRTRMIHEQKPRVMVVVGGMEGVFEEVELFTDFWGSNADLLQESPVPPPLLYVAKDTGGAATLVVREDRFEMLRGFLSRPETPFLHVLEQDWEAEISSEEPRQEVLEHREAAIRSDPRDVPMPPYGAMMQWLVGKIGELSMPHS